MISNQYEKYPLLADADVVIAGAGPGGIGAAVMAAKAGVSVILLEHYGMPGGMASIGEVHPFMNNHCNNVSLDAPVYGEWLEAMIPYHNQEEQQALAAENNKDYTYWRKRAINKNIAALAAEDLLLKYKVKVMYHHKVVDVVKSDRRITSVIVHTAGGFGIVTGKCFVDATGDGNLAAAAGCAFEQGDEKGGCQPMTLCFKLGDVAARYRKEGYLGFDPEWMKQLQKLYKEAVADGVITCPRENILMFPVPEAPDVVHFNTVRVIRKNSTSGSEMSDAEIEGRRQLRELFFWLRKNAPGFENARLVSMAAQIGVRESRRITGRNYLTVESFFKAEKFPDGIARCNYPVDIHNPFGSGTTMHHLPKNDFFELPYGCIVARDVDNLTIAGRPVSVDVAIHSSIRVMPPACSIGQAAGASAALAAKNNTVQSALDGIAVREFLRSKGANL